MFKVNKNGSTRKSCEIFTKLTKTLEKGVKYVQS